jgi:Spy/CpxP family protein refolding chaperone
MSTEPSIQPVAAPKPSRWRRFFVGSALVLSGIIVGAGGTAMSQGYHRWSDDGRYERSDGPRFFRDRDGDRSFRDRDGDRNFRDRDGDRSFRDRDGGRSGWFDRDDDGRRGWGGGHRFGGHRFGFNRGGGSLTPGRIERMVDRLGWAVDASSEQKEKIKTIVQRVADDLRSSRDQHRDLRRQIRDVLAAPTIDRGKLEALRTENMRLADQASQRITTALAEAAEVLTPDQRADLARRLERFGPRRG